MHHFLCFSFLCSISRNFHAVLYAHKMNGCSGCCKIIPIVKKLTTKGIEFFTTGSVLPHRPVNKHSKSAKQFFHFMLHFFNF